MADVYLVKVSHRFDTCSAMRYTIEPDSRPTVPVLRSLYMQAPVSMLRSSIQPITRTHGQEQAEYVGMTTRRHVMHARYHEVHGCLTM